MMVRLYIPLVAAVAFTFNGGLAHGQVAAVPAVAVPAVAPAATPTLWSFLGVPQGVKKVRGALTNRRGNRPQREPQPALKALNDPLNFFSPNAAIRTAAEVKLQEDLAPQKIKAIKYLASIGCGCYDKGGEVTAALIAAAEDCTEEVRLTTMEVIAESAANKSCSNCGQICCCNEALVKKLADIAYLRDDTGCYIEPSARVREAAARALAACCPNPEPPCITTEEPTAPDVTPVPPPPPVPLPEIGSGVTPLPEGAGDRRDDREKTLDELEREAQELEDSLPDRIESDAVPNAKSSPQVGTGISISMSDRRVRATAVGFAAEALPASEVAARVVPPAANYPKLERMPSAAAIEIAPSAPAIEIAPPAPAAEVVSAAAQVVPSAAAVKAGVVNSYNSRTGIAGVQVRDLSSKPQVGQHVLVRGVVGGQVTSRGLWQVVAVEPTWVRIQAVEPGTAPALIPGDEVFAD